MCVYYIIKYCCLNQIYCRYQLAKNYIKKKECSFDIILVHSPPKILSETKISQIEFENIKFL